MGKNNTPCIEVRHVNKSFTQNNETLEVLNDISFTVNKGEICVIVGESGCGKSTLLRVIAGLDPDHEGTVIVDGEVVTKPSKKRGIVFQEHRLFPWLNIEQNVGFALNGADRKTCKELVSRQIELVGLKGFEKSLPKQLSGGMAQRAGIARALVNSPPVLLLDEPFGALDTFTKIRMQEEIKRIQHQSGTTMVLVTHDIDEAVYLADYVIMLSSRPGKVRRIVSVELPEPRDRNSYGFLEIRKLIYNEFFERKDVVEDYTI